MNPLHAEILASLEGLRDAPAEPRDLRLLPIALRVVGDALRASIPLPAELRADLRALPDDALRDAAREVVRALDVDRLPARDFDDPWIEDAIRERDEAESVRVAFARAAIARREPPDRFDVELSAALERRDARLRALVDRGRAERALGDRTLLRGADAWLATFPAERDAPVDAGASLGSVPSTAPPDAVIDAWLCDGKHRRWVEGHAARDPAFAEDLKTLIELHPTDDATVSLVPFTWLRATRSTDEPGVDRAVVVLADLRPPLRVAAATGPIAVEARETRLTGIGAAGLKALLRCTAVDATLTLYARPGEVVSISFGDARLDAPNDGQWWKAVTPLTDSPLPLDVLFSDGERFTIPIALPSPGPS